MSVDKAEKLSLPMPCDLCASACAFLKLSITQRRRDRGVGDSEYRFVILSFVNARPAARLLEVSRVYGSFGNKMSH